MSLFLITVPRVEREQGQQKPEKELIAVMEQLFTSFANIHAQGWNKFLHGEPYIALEMAVHHIGEEIHFYTAVPKNYEAVFEKQVHGLFPAADVTKISDYNIFNLTGVTAGAYLSLKSNPILPLKTYQTLASDPLGAIATSLSKLEKEGEGAAIQILIRPSHRSDIRTLAQKVSHHMQMGVDFKKALALARSKTSTQSKNQQELPRVVTPFEQETVKALQIKASRPLFDTNVRLVVSAATQPRAQQLLDDISGAFVQFASPDLNSFSMNKVSGGTLDRFVFNYAFRVFDARQTMCLSSEEVTSLYHFPMTPALLPRVKYLKSQPAEAPANLPQEGIMIGTNVFRGTTTVARIAPDDRRRHLYIIGQTGTGKSVALKSMIRQDIEAGQGVCVIDPHGDLAEFVLSVVPKTRVDDVIYFNPADIERPLGLNLLETDPARPEQKTFVANEFYTIMKTIYKDLPEAFGPMFEQYYKNSVLLLLDVFERRYQENGNSVAGIEDDRPTLAEIPRVLADGEYRRALLAKETNPLVKNFWEQEAEKAGGEAALANMVPYITSKLNPFLANDYLRPIIAQPSSAFDFRAVMDTRKIFVVNASKGKIGDLNANLLGLVIVSKLLMAALSRDTTDPAKLADLYLYIDEFQNFTTPSIATILSEARKYRLDLIVAHQFTKQLAEPIRDAVFGNVGSMMVFRINPDDAEYLKNKFAPVFSPQDLINIDNFNAYVSLLIGGQTSRPFNIKIPVDLVFNAGSPVVAKAVQEISRIRYGRSRTEVDQEIKARYIPSV